MIPKYWIEYLFNSFGLSPIVYFVVKGFGINFCLTLDNDTSSIDKFFQLSYKNFLPSQLKTSPSIPNVTSYTPFLIFVVVKPLNPTIGVFVLSKISTVGNSSKS